MLQVWIILAIALLSLYQAVMAASMGPCEDEEEDDECN